MGRFSFLSLSLSVALYLYVTLTGKLFLGRQAGFLEGINYCETGPSIRRVTDDTTEREEGQKNCLIAAKKELM